MGSSPLGLWSASASRRSLPISFALLEAGQLEHALADGEDAHVAVAGEHARVGSGIVVVEQLEEEAEAAAGAAGGLVGEAVAAVGVHGAGPQLGQMKYAIDEDSDRARAQVTAIAPRSPHVPPCVSQRSASSAAGSPIRRR